MFSDEYKAEVVELCRTSAKSIAQVARDLGIGETAVRRWVAQAEIDAGRRPGLTTEEHAELVVLRKENRVLREERDLLRSATAFSGTGDYADPTVRRDRRGCSQRVSSGVPIRIIALADRHFYLPT